MGTHGASANFTLETKTSLLFHKQIEKVLGGYCGYPRTEDEVERSNHWTEDQG